MDWTVVKRIFFINFIASTSDSKLRRVKSYYSIKIYDRWWELNEGKWNFFRFKWDFLFIPSWFQRFIWPQLYKYINFCIWEPGNWELRSCDNFSFIKTSQPICCYLQAVHVACSMDKWTLNMDVCTNRNERREKKTPKHKIRKCLFASHNSSPWTHWIAKQVANQLVLHLHLHLDVHFKYIRFGDKNDTIIRDAWLERVSRFEHKIENE